MRLDMFEVVIINRSPNRWEWLVCNRDRIPIMQGWEKTRAAAKYQGERALFILLASGWRSHDPPQTP
jgi:hypothetical protein